MKQNRLIRFDGVVTAVLSDGRYQVRFPDGHDLTADQTTAESDAPVIGDTITVEISHQDNASGRLFFRRADRSEDK